MRTLKKEVRNGICTILAISFCFLNSNVCLAGGFFDGLRDLFQRRQQQTDTILGDGEQRPASQDSSEPSNVPPPQAVASRSAQPARSQGGFMDTIRNRREQMERAMSEEGSRPSTADDGEENTAKEPPHPPVSTPPKGPNRGITDTLRARRQELERAMSGGDDPFATSDSTGVGGFMGDRPGVPSVDSRSMQESTRGMEPAAPTSGGSYGGHSHNASGRDR